MKEKKILREETRKKKRTSDSGNSIKGLMRINLCTVLAMFVFGGSRLFPGWKNSSVFAASSSAAQKIPTEFVGGMDSEQDLITRPHLPPGIAGIVSGVEEAVAAEQAVGSSGISCEYVMVGAHIRMKEEPVFDLNAADSMNSILESFDREINSMVSVSTLMTDSDYQNLLKIVEAEAGTEDIKGRILVANVIMNRVRHEEFPDTITEVIWQSDNGVPQFSPTYDGRIYTVTVSDETREAVKQALEGVDYSEGALFFVMKSAADQDNVKWFEEALVPLFKHGVHDFYTYPEEANRV